MYFIIDGRNKIQHPTKKLDMIHRWIKTGKARFRGKNLVQVTKNCDSSKTIKCKFIVGIDPGYKNIGFSIFKIFKNKIQNILNGEVTTRTSEITKLLQEKKMFRRNRRSNHRKNNLRKFCRVKFKAPRWRNRRKKPFAPTHIHLIDSHLNVLNNIFGRINYSETEIALEYFKFDSQKALDPTISSWRYQKGPQFGFENIKAFVRARDNYTCQICGEKSNLRVHHIQEKSNGGSDRPENLITFCENCHNLIHQNLAECPKVSNASPMRDSGILNSCMKELVNTISPEYTITGADTAAFRNYYNIEKSHINDAKMIALAKIKLEEFEYEDFSEDIFMNQYRRHTRNFIKRYEDRKYYDSENYITAWNRKARSSQDKNKPSLQEFKQEYPEERLSVKAGKKISFRANSSAKFRPGDVFKYQENAYVLRQWASTQGSVTSEDDLKFKTKTCRKLKNNSGLTIISR